LGLYERLKWIKKENVKSTKAKIHLGTFPFTGTKEQELPFDEIKINSIKLLFVHIK